MTFCAQFVAKKGRLYAEEAPAAVPADVHEGSGMV